MRLLTRCPVQRASRRRQRGAAEALVPLITVAAYVFLGGLVIVFLLSILAPIKLLRGRGRIVGAAIVISGWILTFWFPHHLAMRRMDAQVRCTQELKDFPPAIAVDGFLDEGAALRKASVWTLFAERHLGFLEVKVHELHLNQRGNAAERYIAYPDGDQEPLWTVNVPAGTYVRLELGKKGDPLCAQKLPYGIEGRFDTPPFLPDTCLKISHSSTSTARYALMMGSKANEPLMIHGTWVLKDRQTDQNVVSLTTSDTEASISSNRISSLDSAKSQNCRTYSPLPRSMTRPVLRQADEARDNSRENEGRAQILRGDESSPRV